MDTKETITKFVNSELKKLFNNEPDEDIVRDLTNTIYASWMTNVYIEDNVLVIETNDPNVIHYIDFGKRILGNKFILFRNVTIDKDVSTELIYYYDIETGEWDIVFDE